MYCIVPPHYIIFTVYIQVRCTVGWEKRREICNLRGSWLYQPTPSPNWRQRQHLYLTRRLSASPAITPKDYNKLNWLYNCIWNSSKHLSSQLTIRLWWRNFGSPSLFSFYAIFGERMGGFAFALHTKECELFDLMFWFNHTVNFIECHYH